MYLILLLYQNSNQGDDESVDVSSSATPVKPGAFIRPKGKVKQQQKQESTNVIRKSKHRKRKQNRNDNSNSPLMSQGSFLDNEMQRRYLHQQQLNEEKQQSRKQKKRVDIVDDDDFGSQLFPSFAQMEVSPAPSKSKSRSRRTSKYGANFDDDFDDGAVLTPESNEGSNVFAGASFQNMNDGSGIERYVGMTDMEEIRASRRKCRAKSKIKNVRGLTSMRYLYPNHKHEKKTKVIMKNQERKVLATSSRAHKSPHQVRRAQECINTLQRRRGGKSKRIKDAKNEEARNNYLLNMKKLVQKKGLGKWNPPKKGKRKGKGKGKGKAKANSSQENESNEIAYAGRRGRGKAKGGVARGKSRGKSKVQLKRNTNEKSGKDVKRRGRGAKAKRKQSLSELPDSMDEQSSDDNKRRKGVKNSKGRKGKRKSSESENSDSSLVTVTDESSDDNDKSGRHRKVGKSGKGGKSGKAGKGGKSGKAGKGGAAARKNRARSRKQSVNEDVSNGDVSSDGDGQGDIAMKPSAKPLSKRAKKISQLPRGQRHSSRLAAKRSRSNDEDNESSSE